MFLDFTPQAGVWAALSAPLCAVYAAAAAHRATAADAAAPLRAPILVAVLMSSLTVAFGAMHGEGVWTLLLVSGFVYLALYDMRVMAIPVWPVLAYVALGLIAGELATLSQRALAASVGWGAFIALNGLYRLVRRRDGLGGGDALVAALLGAWLSFEGLVWSVALGGVAGVACAAPLSASRHRPLPFVPALGAGACLYLMARRLVS